MITKDDEQRLENWARANRECFRVTRGATAVFCDSLKYQYGLPEDYTGRGSMQIRSIDLKDANRIDMAYRSPELPTIHKQVLRMAYISRVAPAIIEKRLSLGYKTFWRHKERAVEAIMRIVKVIEEKQF